MPKTHHPSMAKNFTVIVLFESFAPSLALINEIEILRKRSEQILCIVVHPLLYPFLVPLKSLGIEVLLAPQYEDGLENPNWLDKFGLIRRRRKFAGKIPGGKIVYSCCSVLDAPTLAVFSGLLKKAAQFYYSPEFDGRSNNPDLSKKARDWKSWIKGIAFSSLLKVPVEMVRPWSPVPIIAENIIQKYTTTVSLSREALDGNECLERLMQSDGAEVLWLFTDHVLHYGEESVDLVLFHKAWLEMVEVVSAIVPKELQAVKAHPRIAPLVLPDYFVGIREIPRDIPVEFYKFPRLKLVVAVNSLSLKSLVMQGGVMAVSAIDLIGAKDHAFEELSNCVNLRVNESGKIHRIQNLHELASLLT